MGRQHLKKIIGGVTQLILHIIIKTDLIFVNSIRKSIMFYEKQHCCCCVPLAEGVMLVGIYGTSFHVGLLSIQLAYNQATLIPSPIVEEDKYSTPSQYGNTISNYGPHFNPIPYNYLLTDQDYYSSAAKHYTSKELVDKDLVDAVYPILLFAHVLGIVVNLLLGIVFNFD